MRSKHQEYQEAVLFKSILKVFLCAGQCVGCKHQNRDLSALMHFLYPQLTSLGGTNSVSKPPWKSLWPNQTGSSLSPCGHRIKQMAGSVLDASCYSCERTIARHKPRNAANPGALSPRCSIYNLFGLLTAPVPYDSKRYWGTVERACVTKPSFNLNWRFYNIEEP